MEGVVIFMPLPLDPGKEFLVSIELDVGRGSQSCEEEKYLLLLSGIEPRLLGSPSRCLVKIKQSMH
jgi:hypothetical protein